MKFGVETRAIAPEKLEVPPACPRHSELEHVTQRNGDSMAKMTEDDVRALYKHCRALATAMANGMTWLLHDIGEYHEQKHDQKTLKSTLLKIHGMLGWHVEKHEQLKAATDWAIVESVAERSATNPRSSVAYEVLEFPGRIWFCIRATLEASDEEFGDGVHNLAIFAERGRYGEITERDLLAEEGRVLQRMRDAAHIVTGYLGLIVNNRAKTITRSGSDIAPIELSPLLLQLCNLFVTGGSTGVTRDQLNQLGGEASARNKAISTLRDLLENLEVTITDGRGSKPRVLVEVET